MQEALLKLREILAFELMKIGETSVTVSTLATAVLVMIVAFWASALIRRAMIRRVKESSVPERGSVAVTARLLHYTIVLVGIGVALSTLGIQLGALFAAGAVFAVAIGFAMQTITQNFVSGVILLFERSIKPGDIVEVEGQIVRIRELGIRATIARGLNEQDLIIPNSLLVQNTVTNYTLRDALCRIDANVGVVYGSDMKRVREVLEAVAESVEWRSREHDPAVFMREFGASSVNFMVSVFTENPWNLRQQRSALNEAIWWGLEDAEITIAFPQLDVHFDPRVSEALAGIGATPREKK
ncbi:MAG TPA: mechanosensitive ion channel domain-containing protein [Gemmatimonadota bacterium]|nr:mechanosensitive ion channel domain-containing protein [Gemmatimonadota bacterium]